MNKTYLFTSESVSEGHPDKVADQISDAVLDHLLAYDPDSKVACETLVTTGQVVIAGEVKSEAYIDLMEVTRGVIKKIGYDRSELKFDGEACGVLNALHEQSADINRGVDRDTEKRELQGAGDQGMMFGFACDETDTYMPLTIDLSHRLLLELAALRREQKEMTYTIDGVTRTYLRPDSKSQVTVEYSEDGHPLRVDTIVISTQHDEFITPDNGLTQEAADKKMQERIEADVRRVLIPRVKATLPAEVAAMIDDNVKVLVNPTGKFVIGGPHGDTGLTGRKIIVDTYGGRGAHGGGAFSGKDPSKVDRSAA
ncbi:MAG TPA: methionine adenosyltransferase, partial [Porphyromonadaceae bacterium]|nr:methionine adenosyltransferase [Porphyromonadaceae bacterium]